jgi:hypothetical protein
MKTHSSLPDVTMRTGRSPGGAHRKTRKRTVRSLAIRGILVLAIVSAGLSAAAPTLLGHGGAGHVHAVAHQPAGSRTSLAANDSSAPSYRPWMY